MKLQTILLASVVFAQTALAQTQPGAPIPLPAGSKLSPAAKRAAEAPTWTAPVTAPSTITTSGATAATSPTNQPAATNGAAPPSAPFGVTSGVAISPEPAANVAAPVPSPQPNQFNALPAMPSDGITSAPSAVVPASVAPAATPIPQTLPPSDDARPLTPNPTEFADPAAEAARPLQSVMIRRSTSAPSAPSSATQTGVAPARFDAPLAPSPLPAAIPTVAPNTGVLPASTVAPVSVGPPLTVPSAKAPSVETPVDPEKAAAARAASELLAGSLTVEKGSAPLGLFDAIKTAPEPSRAAAVRSYWQLSRAWSDYHWSLDELKRLENVLPSRSAVDSPMLSTARAVAAARVSDAQIAVSAAAEALARASGAAPAPQSSFPIDVPLVGLYRSYFDVLFASHVAPGRTREIDRSLPIRLKSINDLTAAVQSASSAVHYAEEAHAKGEIDMRTVLSCHETFHDQRRAFLDAVLAYNSDIAEYAATVASPATPNEKFVGMLITTKQTQRPLAAGGSNNAAPSTAKSSSDGWVSSTQRPAEAATAAQQPTLAPTGPLGQHTDPFAR